MCSYKAKAETKKIQKDIYLLQPDQIFKGATSQKDTTSNRKGGVIKSQTSFDGTKVRVQNNNKLN